MKKIGKTKDALLLRTHFGNEAAWTKLCASVRKPVGSFRANVTPLSDPAYRGASPKQIASLLSPKHHSFAFVADRVALEGREHAIVVVDVVDEPGRSFRVIPKAAWSVENNLSLANMDFSEFADAVDKDGVFRGFGDDDGDDESSKKARKRGSSAALDPEEIPSEAWRLLQGKKPHEALALYEKGLDARDFDQSFYVNALYALNLANEKRPLPKAHVRRVLERVMSRRRLHADTFWNAACTCVALGDVDRAIEHLRTAKRRGVNMKKCLADRAFKPIAGDARFIALERATRA